MRKDQLLHDSLADSYDHKYTASRASQMFLEYEIGGIVKSISQKGDNAIVLELGCGTGIAASYIVGNFIKADGSSIKNAGNSINYTENSIKATETSIKNQKDTWNFNRYLGVDYSQGMVALAGRKKPPGCSFLCADAEKLPLSDNSVETVICRGSLHHMNDTKKVLTEIQRVIKDGGQLIILEPCRNNPIIEFIRYLLKRFASSYSPDQKSFSESELVGLYKDHNFSGIGVRYIGYLTNPFEFTDKFPLSSLMPEFLFKKLIDIDEFLSKSCLRKYAWGILVTGSGQKEKK